MINMTLTGTILVFLTVLIVVQMVSMWTGIDYIGNWAEKLFGEGV